MEEHAEGRSKSTACRRPFIRVLCEYYYAKSDAVRRERYFKTQAGKRVLRLMLRESLNSVVNHPVLLQLVELTGGQK